MLFDTGVYILNMNAGNTANDSRPHCWAYLQMLMVGEESGTVDKMMLRMSDAFDREVETSIQRLLMLLEPALIVGLGIVIAGIIMSVLIGIISINELPV